METETEHFTVSVSRTWDAAGERVLFVSALVRRGDVEGFTVSETYGGNVPVRDAVLAFLAGRVRNGEDLYPHA